jgi:hypothetical protein
MKMRLTPLLATLLCVGVPALAQTPTVESTKGRSRVVVVTDNSPKAPQIKSTKPVLDNAVSAPVQPAATAPQGPSVQPQTFQQPIAFQPTANTNAVPNVNLTFSEIKSKIAEAKRQLQSRPSPTASVDPALQTSWVKIAFMSPKTHQIDYVTISKDSFLKTNQTSVGISETGKQITTRTIRANGVNTPIQVFDNLGEAQLPIMVQYPVERGGKYYETAYYMSTHPGLITPEVVNAGKLYVHNVIEIARDRLRSKGVTVSSKIADIAERLATVEHVDHQRFRTEPHPVIYNDIFTLYALNEGQTYRYSVSSAGAGGMVQMIPSTYAMVRRQYPNAGLIPDFVEGMRNHVNATEAMLLYMNGTWSDLAASPTVTGAIASGIATQEQLMAAGYNSNPAKLPGYINRGGENWTNLIPRETQKYLQIYSSLEQYVPMAPRTR